ncbi:MAG: late competence development ComFB family protein [Clostridia bacterium]|jgi:hypothetical protein|nr:late competence development ComFB family protein [Clostridia bacterium]
MSSLKKEIDKELMYKKLMPTALENHKAPPLPITYTAETAATAPIKPVPPNHQTNRREIGIPALDTQKTVLVNTTETLVLEKLDAVLNRFNCCKCDRCKKDIVALALNKLPPKYMVLAETQPLPIIGTQENAQVVSAIIQAILTVRNHARH